MKLHPIIVEPSLEFARGTHVCPRAGISAYDVYDAKFDARRDRILVGAVGTTEGLSKLASWLELCAEEIPGKVGAGQSTLFPGFCGFNQTVGYRASLRYLEEITRTLNHSDIKKVINTQQKSKRVEAAVELYLQEIRFLAQNRIVDVIVCLIPDNLYNHVSKENIDLQEETVEETEQDDLFESNFRRLLKARSMRYGKPIQLVREFSLESHRTQQDIATKAWNFCTAIYYKANQTVPWKLKAAINRPSICHVGIGFYRSRDRRQLHTSLAQLFDELGNSVILRGTEVDFDKDKDDRTPHLDYEQSHNLLSRALIEYEVALGNFPGRLVVHKTSNFNAVELDGFMAATSEKHVSSVDFVTIQDTKMKLFREGIYPPYRGTHIEIDPVVQILYTRGSVEYYRTYPGKYIPQPLEIRIVESDESPSFICRELLGLTKMNWNNTQFDGKYPITIQCARKVGEVMKYLGSDDPDPQIRYSFYM